MLRRVYFCLNHVRSLRTNTRKGNGFRKVIGPNPGIENRVKIIKMETHDHDNLEFDDLDDLESDFTEAGDLHREYEREKRTAARALSYTITKSKYFKSPKLPNLLLWSEKEQIRHLHHLDPNEWDVEKLSRCFPAPLHVIKKIIKAKWSPKNKSTMERHDKSVERNWIMLKEGKFELEDDLKRHLLSFTSRRASIPTDDLSKSSKQIIIHNQQTGSSEFSDIVNNNTSQRGLYEHESTLEKYKQIEVNIPEFMQTKINSKFCDPKSDSYVLPGKASVKHELVSYKEFKEELIKSAVQGAEKDELSREYYDYLNKGNCVQDIQPSPHEERQPEMKEDSKKENKLTKYKKNELDENLTPQQLDVFMKAQSHKYKIIIPKEKRDPSAIYKMNDCFYDADGKFLYRVPGMK